MTKNFQNNCTSIVKCGSTITIENQHKVAIVSSLMRDVRNHIDSWHKQVYTASIWSVGLFLVAASYWTVHYDSLQKQKVLFLLAICLFGVFTQSYLWCSINALKNNGKVLVRCEKALKLNKGTDYLEEGSFFSPSSKGNWVTPYDCIIISVLNLVILNCVQIIIWFDIGLLIS